METIWLIIVVAALVLEILTPSALVSVWFSIGALAAWVCALMDLPLAVQIVVCFMVSLIFILIARPIAMRYMRGNTIPTNADRLIGETAVVIEEIGEDAWGAVKVRGAQWSAVSLEHDTIEVATHVRIDAIEGAKLIVHKIEQ